MSVKPTESGVATLLKTLNSLICEEGLLTTEQRQNMVMTVATLGALGERVRQSIEDKAARKAARAEKKPREPDPIFPKAGTPWSDDDDELLRTLIDGIPDVELDHHIRWLSEKLGRTPHAIALRIVNEGRMDEEWSKTFRPLAQVIRDEVAAANGKTLLNQHPILCSLNKLSLLKGIQRKVAPNSPRNQQRLSFTHHSHALAVV